MFKIGKSNSIGNAAEKAAKRYLVQQGLDFVTRNFHSRYGEIDLIFKDKEVIVFIEVRCRNNPKFGNSIETIDHRKQKKIIKTAQYYLHQHKLTESVSCRFDVIGIESHTSGSNAMSVRWIKNAFC